jgi:hypothetical protein
MIAREAAMTVRVHTLYRRSSWMVEVEHRGPPPARYEGKAAAMYVGQLLAERLGVDHVIHARSGLIVAELPAEAEQAVHEPAVAAG